jgi:hypothetical protein
MITRVAYYDAYDWIAWPEREAWEHHRRQILAPIDDAAWEDELQRRGTAGDDCSETLARRSERRA